MYTHATDAGWISRSHRAISPFRLARPNTAQEAVELLSRESNATIIAGGIDLVRRMRGGDAWSTLIDITSIDGMREIENGGDHIRIGALATHWDVESSALLAAQLSDFQAAWTTIGNVRVRMAGTVGGNLLAGEPGYDGRVILGVLGAELVFATGDGEVTVAVDSPSGAFPDGAVLTAVRIPIVPDRKMLFDRSLKPLVSVAVSIDGEAHAIGVGCAFPEPAIRSGIGDVVADAVSSSLPEPVDNAMGGAAYRRRMAGVLAARAYRKLTRGNQ